MKHFSGYAHFWQVLHKCGQYQDLLLLSSGHANAFTYVDQSLYGNLARPVGQPLFENSADQRALLCRHFDYTLVLDADCRMEPLAAHELMQVAAAKPHLAIIQPRIKHSVETHDTLYQHLEYVRNRLNAATETAMARAFGRCQFYGKGLIKNRVYVEQVLGTPTSPRELVPANALSHDTYESVLLHTHYVSNVHIYERAPLNYVSWNSRQRRWNQGDLILGDAKSIQSFAIICEWLISKLVHLNASGMIYHSCLLGWIQFCQRCCQGRKYFKTHLRYRPKFTCVTYYLASQPLRRIFEKPFWLLYVILHACLFKVCE